jgi:hypothetical protein
MPGCWKAWRLKSRAALDSAEPFGRELRVERLVAGCGCQKQAASDRQPEQSLTDSDNNSKLENGNFGFIFCFNDVNMLKDN